MSPSKRPPATAPALVRVVASAPRDTEVFLIDHSFALVRRSVGTLDEHVPPGIYTLKFRRGTTVREVIKIVPSEAAIVEVPFPDDLQSLETAQTRGPAGVTLLGIPQAAPMPESAQEPPSGDSLRVEVWPAASGASHPAAGLTIRDASGALRRDLGTLTASDPLSMVASDSTSRRVAIGCVSRSVTQARLNRPSSSRLGGRLMCGFGRVTTAQPTRLCGAPTCPRRRS